MYQTSIRNKKKHVSFNRDKEINYDINPQEEEYAYVVKLLGNCRARILSNSGIESIGIIRGTLRKFSKRILVENGDIVVISKREYQRDKVDIVHKFNTEQAQHLIKTEKLSQILINCYNKQIDIDKKTPAEAEDYDDCIQFEDSSNASDSCDEYDMRDTQYTNTYDYDVEDDDNLL